MKKILLLISQYFSNFIIVLFVFSLFLMYIMFKVPVAFWVGSMTGRTFTDNVGGLLIGFFDNNYIIFFLIPFFPFLVGFFLLSIFIWIYYRRDKEAGRVGFGNTVLCILSAFILIFLPIKSAQLGYKIQEQRERQISQVYDDDTVYINKGIDKEFLKLYQTLADESIQEWRKDPILVVTNELETGDLTYLSNGDDKLTLIATSTDESGKITRAVVLLENSKLKAEISLNQYWESDDGVWLVKSYKKID